MQHLQRGDIPPSDWPVLPHNQTQSSAPGHPNWQSNAAAILLAVLICLVIVVSFIIGIWIRNGRPASGVWWRMWGQMTRRTQSAGQRGAAQGTALVPMQAGVPGVVVQGPAQVPGVQNPAAQAQHQAQASNTGATTQTQITNQDQGLENTRSSGSSEATVVGRTAEEEHAYFRSLRAAGSAPGVPSLAGRR
ncbi:hypothetical protein LTR10_008607 [Elasticomyces elasticus]|uniref:Uncharacterized protein n=1 Tax=Elasticomyces elasticus TaxID=574655 RepID=A0AAN7ZLZ5_9PEZI|nr:hypothetical protein LTR10_008607 [Elasticomyces elasticus]KAK4967478.1 hypothetical protein LTR42_010827 [Elasticomyces elasticus]KAK5694488.1 hypothetical protein LTR97_009078 [Elasticomyces elasticus]